jgi:hypothetical protein
MQRAVYPTLCRRAPIHGTMYLKISVLCDEVVARVIPPAKSGIDEALGNAGERPHAASVFSTSLIQYEVPKTIASSLKL